jgi:hypothetical protein
VVAAWGSGPRGVARSRGRQGLGSWSRNCRYRMILEEVMCVTVTLAENPSKLH